jgi:hypothetical protein
MAPVRKMIYPIKINLPFHLTFGSSDCEVLLKNINWVIKDTNNDNNTYTEVKYLVSLSNRVILTASSEGLMKR